MEVRRKEHSRKEDGKWKEKNNQMERERNSQTEVRRKGRSIEERKRANGMRNEKEENKKETDR